MVKKRLSGRMRRRLRAKGVLLEPVIRVGKEGLTSGLIQEVDRQLEDKGLIKVRFEKSAVRKWDRKELAERLAELVDAELVDVRGRTAVLFRPREGWSRFKR